ncbi:response regulator [uncultured Fibrella sp.]|uniref:response regulator n=1 Tax=uncultured Fibrella sp. TaxID=1284596 RepID=UPI0035C9B105
MSQIKAKHIFLVDDDEDDQFLVKQVIKQHSPESTVEVLDDGEKLIQALKHASSLPSLVLLDLNMPRMNGLEALRHVRANQSYDEIPIVILTTSDNEHDRQQALRLQATDYLVKPGSAEQMSQLVSVIKQQWFL